MSIRIPILAVAIALLGGCGDGGKPEPAPAPRLADAEFVTRFHRGVNELEQHRFVEAAQTFDELTKARPEIVAPWINLASAQLNRNVEASHAPCLAAADRATALDPKAPQPYFLRGVLFKHLGKSEEAERNFREALTHAPDDPAVLYYLATIVAYRDVAEAASLFEKAIEGESHLASAYYALAQAKRGSDRAAVERLINQFQAFKDANTGALMNIVYTEMGRLGEAVRDLPVAAAPGPAPATPTIDFASPASLPGAAIAALEIGDKVVLACLEDSDGGQNVVLHSWAGAAFARMSALPVKGATVRLAPGDFDQDGMEDLAVLDASGVRLLRFDGQSFQPVPGNPLGAEPVTGLGLGWSDLDQDADLDLVVWAGDRVAAYVNKRNGTFERWNPKPSDTRAAFQPQPLPAAPRGVSQVCATDLDSDGDPDLLIASDAGLKIWRNDRLMRFADVTARAGLSDTGPVGAVRVEDLDGDRAFDIVAKAGDGVAVFRHATAGPFRLTFSRTSLGLAGAWPGPVGDLDCDGSDEILIVRDRAIAAYSAPELVRGGTKASATIDAGGPPGAVMLVDVNGDLALDLVVSLGDPRAADNTRVHLGRKQAKNHAIAIRLAGRVFANTMRANTGGIGARVEVMAGSRSKVREVRAGDGVATAGPLTLHFGLGPHENVDYVRIVWPDDVLQSEGWIPANQRKVIEEFQRKASSCPILFAWNGERFECVTDFLGVGGLGFLIEPGVFGPPDPTERILIPHLEPRDGKLELRIHEPFEEITYLDMAKLIVVDHPADVDVVPDERFAVNAPTPDGRLLAIAKRIDPTAARDGRGNDVLSDVVAVDRRHARATPDPRFLGYAEPTTFELDFGAGLAARSASDSTYLALDGWVEYPYSHINLAAHQAGVRLEALSVDVEVAGKGFVRIQNEACYPAGMPRTMTLPLGRLPDGLTGRLRLSTNQELWIDRLYLFEPAGVAIDVKEIAASGAVLRAAGYPREYSPDGGQPRLYDYDIRDPSFPWKTMAGAYTRFGDVAELLREADDCYAVFGGGEEIVLTFDPPAPPAPGMRRTYVLDSFGWCKDMDPHTAFPYTVEPLPFRGMSNYPYPDGERFPDGPAQRRWRELYQTRTLSGTRAR